MTTCNDIVRLALGRLRQLRAGESPQGNEAADSMIALQGLYDGWVSSGLFGRLNDTIITTDYTANEQDRVINDGGFTVTLPLQYSNTLPMGTYYPVWPDERTWTALQSTVARPPRDLSMIETLSSGVLARFLYDARKRAWVRIDALSLTDEAPLAERGSIGLASCLAGVLSDDYGAVLGPDATKRAALFMWGLSSRYDSQRVSAQQSYF